MIKVQIYFGIFCVIFCSGALSAQPFGYEYIPEAGGWLRLHAAPATWPGALLRCILEGGILASPSSSAVTSAMKSKMAAQQTKAVFIGIHAALSEEEFVSLDGVRISNMSLKWAQGEPDNHANEEQCLAMTEPGEVADVSCSSVFRYFCYRKNPNKNVEVPTNATERNTLDSDEEIAATESVENITAAKPTTPGSAVNIIATKSTTPSSAENIIVTESTTPSSAQNIMATESTTPSSAQNIMATESTTPSSAQNIMATESTTPSSAENIIAAESTTPDSDDDIQVRQCNTLDSEYKWDQRTGSCYKFHMRPREWSDAAAKCRDEHAHLTVINSDAEAQVLKEIFEKFPHTTDGVTNVKNNTLHVGISYRKEENMWRTIFDETLDEAGFAKWSSDEPNNYSGYEYCGSIFRNGLFNDHPCGADSVYICELDSHDSMATFH